MGPKLLWIHIITITTIIVVIRTEWLTTDSYQDVHQAQFSTCLLVDSCPPQHHTT